MKVNILHRLLILLLLLASSFSPGNAQWHKWQVGVGGGAMSYYGDLSDKFVNLNLQEPAYHAFAERHLKSSVYLRLESINGQLLGSDRAPGGWLNRDFGGNSYFSRSLNFRTRVHDANLSLVFYLVPKGERERAPLLSPYIRLGVGVGYFDVFGDLLNENGDRYFYWSDLSIRDKAEDAPDADQAIRVRRDKDYETNLRELAIEKNYNRFKWQIPAAVGLRMRLAEHLSLMLEAQFTYAMTDYLDNVGDLSIRADITDPFTQYAADPAGFIGDGPRAGNRRSGLNDAYLYLNVGLAFNIGSTAPPKFKAPRFYPSVLQATPVEVPVPSDDEALFESLPAIVERETITLDTAAAFAIEYPQWKQLRAIALSYEEVLDSLYYVERRTNQDSILKEDLRQYGQLLPESRAIPSNVKVDSIAMSKVAGTDNRIVLQYFITIPEDISTTASSARATDSTYAAKAFVYRVDTLMADSLPFDEDSIQIVLADDLAKRKLIDSVYFKALPLASEYRVPAVIGAPVRTESSFPQPDTAAGMRYERINFPETIRFQAPPLSMKDMPLAREQPISTLQVPDTLLLKSIEALQQRIDALQAPTAKEATAPATSKDTLLIKKLTDLDEQMKTLRTSNNPGIARTEAAPTVSPAQPVAQKNAADSTLDKMQRMIDQLAMQRSTSNQSSFTPPSSKTSSDKLSRAERRSIRQDNKADRAPIFIAYSNPALLKKTSSTEESSDTVPKEVSVDTLALSNDADVATGLDSLKIRGAVESEEVSIEDISSDSMVSKPVPELKPNAEDNSALKMELESLRKGQDSLIMLMNKVFEKMATPAPVTVVAPPSLDPIDIVLRQGPVRVFFGVGQAAVSSQYRAGLDGIAEQLRKYPELNVELKGFADPTGNAAANMLLSEKRAQAVQQYLVKTHRISSDRIVILPVGQETDSQDMSFSRRVEVSLIRK